MKILDLYKSIIASLGLQADEDGLISTALGEHPEPATISGRRWALPTDALLMAGGFNEDSKLVAFHPISENVVLTKSPVLDQIEKCMNVRLWAMALEITKVLLPLAADSSQHKRMKIKEHGLLSVFKDVDEKTAKDIMKIFDESTPTGKDRLLSIYVRQGGVYAGERVSRLARFYPTVVEELEDGKRTVNGITLRVKDVPMFKDYIDYLFKDYADEERYASPSNSMVAPSLHALLKCFAKVANQLNEVVALHAKSFEDPERLFIPLEWVDDIKDLGDFRDKIPALPMNDGAAGVKSGKARQQPAQPAAATSFGGQARQQPATTSSNPVDAFLSKLLPQAPQNFGRANFQPAEAPPGAFRPVGHRAVTARIQVQQQEQDLLPDWAQPVDQRNTPTGHFAPRVIRQATGAL